MTPDERTAAIAQKKTPVGRSTRQWAKGEFIDIEIWRVPVELLVLNAGNRRFHAEKLEWEEQMGRPLDPQAREEDERSIISILLDTDQRISGDEVVGKPSKDAQALIGDWTLRGQEQPLWIRPDGFVVNGNRRLAALKRLAEEHGTATGTYSYVEVVILGDDIDDDELFQMEAREQLTEGLKVRYGDLNLLLTLREAAERHQVDWTDDDSIHDVARLIQDLVGNNPSYAEVQLQTIRYMDQYLDYTGEPGVYQRMIGQVERFRDIGKNMKIALREDPDGALDLLEISFRAVQAGLKHEQIRDVRRLALEEPAVFEGLVEEINDIVENHSDDGIPSAENPTDPDPDADIDVDEEDLAESPVATAPDFPKHDVARAFEVAIENRNSKHRNDAEALLREAAGRLAQVSAENLAALLSKAAVRDALEAIREWVRQTDDVGR
ncbi:MAG: ParB N-terminal domain-containing protein [Actinomycetales bacterium]|nr:ParB N-terminal domain-containing protein [Actinomycetales bacterium]